MHCRDLLCSPLRKLFMTKLHCTLSRARFSSLTKRQKGVTMIEYALIAALIAVVLVVVLGSLGTELGVTFRKIKTALSAANA